MKNITSVENIRTNGKCAEILLQIINSDIYSVLVEYALNETDSRLGRIIENDIKLRRATSTSINSFLSMLGTYYLINHRVVNDDKKRLITLYKSKGMEEYLVNASRCIETDEYGLFSQIANNLEKKCTIKDVRNISSVCWLNPNWILNLYKESPEAINNIIEAIYHYLTSLAEKEIISKTLKVRDVLEVVLAICRLREFDDSVLDPNDIRTREMVSIIKCLDNITRENNTVLNKPFKSRVIFDRDEKIKDGLGAVSDTCYLLITQLTCSKHLNLIGFVDD